MTRHLFVLGAVLLLAAPAPADDEVATLTVRGDAELEKPADQLRLQLGVVTESPSASSAMEDNASKMEDVISALHKTGLTEKEYQTGRFSLQPRYSPRPRNADAEWQPQIIGYRVENTLAIKTTRLELAGKLMEAASSSGANSIDSISFDLADPRVHRAEAIGVATANARSDARALAEAAGVRLVRVRTVTLDQADWRPPVPMAYQRGGAMAMAEGSAPPIAPGDVTVRASVTLVYEIAQQQ